MVLSGTLMINKWANRKWVVIIIMSNRNFCLQSTACSKIWQRSFVHGQRLLPGHYAMSIQGHECHKFITTVKQFNFLFFPNHDIGNIGLCVLLYNGSMCSYKMFSWPQGDFVVNSWYFKMYFINHNRHPVTVKDSLLFC